MRAGLFLLPVLLAGACTSTAEPLHGWRRHEREAAAMGTRFLLVLYARESRPAEEVASAFDAAFGRIAELDARLSDYRPESELSLVGRRTDDSVGDTVRVSEDLARMLREAEVVWERSEGAFDVTVGPLTRLWRRARRQEELPSAARVAEARERVGWTLLGFDPESISVTPRARGMRLDPGGIAKGFALDEALRVLREHGIERALIDGGGDVLCGRAPPGREAWRVALAGYDDPTAGSGELLLLENAAVASSGDLERFVELEGRRYSHLIDPRSGEPIEERRLVSVIAPTGMRADALASAVSVLGSGPGIELLESLAEVEGRIVVRTTEGDRVWASAGFGERLSCSESIPSSPVPGSDPVPRQDEP